MKTYWRPMKRARILTDEDAETLAKAIEQAFTDDVGSNMYVLSDKHHACLVSMGVVYGILRPEERNLFKELVEMIVEHGSIEVWFE